MVNYLCFFNTKLIDLICNNRFDWLTHKICDRKTYRKPVTNIMYSHNRIVLHYFYVIIMMSSIDNKMSPFVSVTQTSWRLFSIMHVIIPDTVQIKRKQLYEITCTLTNSVIASFSAWHVIFHGGCITDFEELFGLKIAEHCLE